MIGQPLDFDLVIRIIEVPKGTNTIFRGKSSRGLKNSRKTGYLNMNQEPEPIRSLLVRVNLLNYSSSKQFPYCM